METRLAPHTHTQAFGNGIEVRAVCLCVASNSAVATKYIEQRERESER